jgi:hypothetical protein
VNYRAGEILKSAAAEGEEEEEETNGMDGPKRTEGLGKGVDGYNNK